jgi:predicted ferric reductase
MLNLSQNLLSNTDEYTKQQYNVLLEISKKLANSKDNTQIIKDLEKNLDLYKVLPNLLIKKALLTKLLPNFNIESHPKHLSIMGIQQSILEGSDVMYTLNIFQFIKAAITNSSPDVNFEDRVEFAFNLFDIDSKGFFGQDEIEKILIIFSEANTLSFSSSLIKEISRVILEEIDNDKSGNISKEKLSLFLENFKNKPLNLNCFGKEKSKTFRKFFIIKIRSLFNNKSKVKHSQLLDDIEMREVQSKHIITTDIKSNDSDITENSEPSSLRNFMIIRGKIIFWKSFYVILNILVGVLYFYLYSKKLVILGIAKFFAGIMMLNSTLLLLCVSITISTTFAGFFQVFLPLGKLIKFHKFMATMFYISAIGHSLAHLCGTFVIISKTPNEKLSELNDIVCCHKLSSVPSYHYLLFQTMPGITGIILLVLMTFIVLTSVESIRKRYFERFWYSHKMYVFIYIFTHLHGSAEIVATQEFWYWVIGPFSLIIFERLFEYFKIFFKNKSNILSYKYLESGIVELTLSKPVGFNFLPGQYCRICVDEISKLEYHPFTISSSPLQDHLTFHISPIGDWTQSLVKLVKNNKSPSSNDLPSIKIDGPYGAPTQTYVKYNHLMMIATGIGATPFSSILKDILFRMKNKDPELNYEEIDFYWMQRKASQFAWLSNIFNDLIQSDTENHLNFNTFYTNCNQKYDFRSFFLWHGLESLKKKEDNKVLKQYSNIFWGRPDWNELFLAKSQTISKGSRIGVFVCGNDELSREIKQLCMKYSTDHIFHFHKENF